MIRAGGRAVTDSTVRRAGQGDEQRRAEGLAVRRGVALAHRTRVNLAPGQVRSVLAAAGRAVPPRGLCRGGLPAHTRFGDLLVQLGDELVKVGRVLPGLGGLVAELLRFGALLDPPLLVVGGRVRGDAGFVLEVPAFPALRCAQRPGLFGAAGADVRQGVPAGDEHNIYLAGVEVGAAQLDRADAGAVLDGQVDDPWRASGMAIRCARADLAVVSVTGHLHLAGRLSRYRTSRTGGTRIAAARCHHRAGSGRWRRPGTAHRSARRSAWSRCLPLG